VLFEMTNVQEKAIESYFATKLGSISIVSDS